MNNNSGSSLNDNEADDLRYTIEQMHRWFAAHPHRDECNLHDGGKIRRNHVEEDATQYHLKNAVLEKLAIHKDIPPFDDLKAWQALFRTFMALGGISTENMFGASCVELHQSNEAFRRFAGDAAEKCKSIIGNEKYSCRFLAEFSPHKFLNNDHCKVTLNACAEVYHYNEEGIGYVTVFPFLGGVLLNSMQVFNESQGKGHGTRLLNLILARAQDAQVKIYLLPAELSNCKPKLKTAQLRAWYARYGFVNTLPIDVPVLRLSHFKGGSTHIIKKDYMCWAPVAPKS